METQRRIDELLHIEAIHIEDTALQDIGPVIQHEAARQPWDKDCHAQYSETQGQ